jgi:predicted O-methyltransferase YrrM
MNGEVQEISEVVAKVDGWLADIEGEFLYNVAKNCKGKGVIVEIGSWKGKSTIWLAKGSKAGNKIRVYAIDPHTGSSEHKRMYGEVSTFEEFKRNIKMAGVEDVTDPIVKTSEEATKTFEEPVEFVFIDGAHEYEMVKLDFLLWFPKLIEGGIIALHDTIGWQGPKKVAKEFVYKSKNFRNVGFVSSITFAQKVKENSFYDRLRSRYILLLKDLCKFAAKLHLPKPVKMIGKRLLGIFNKVFNVASHWSG